MAINTPEKRRSVIDFAKIRGTGMPIPSGSIGQSARVHVLNLYSGIVPVISFFFFWRNRSTPVSTIFTKASSVRDS